MRSTEWQLLTIQKTSKADVKKTNGIRRHLEPRSESGVQLDLNGTSASFQLDLELKTGPFQRQAPCGKPACNFFWCLHFRSSTLHCSTIPRNRIYHDYTVSTHCHCVCELTISFPVLVTLNLSVSKSSPDCPALVSMSSHRRNPPRSLECRILGPRVRVNSQCVNTSAPL